MSFSLIIIAFIFSIVKAFFQKNSTIYKYTYHILIRIYLNPAIDKSVRRYNSSVGLDILNQSISHGTSTQPCKKFKQLRCQRWNSFTHYEFSQQKKDFITKSFNYCANSGLLELNRSASSLKLCLDLLSVSL